MWQRRDDLTQLRFELHAQYVPASACCGHGVAACGGCHGALRLSLSVCLCVRRGGMCLRQGQPVTLTRNDAVLRMTWRTTSAELQVGSVCGAASRPSLMSWPSTLSKMPTMSGGWCMYVPRCMPFPLMRSVAHVRALCCQLRSFTFTDETRSRLMHVGSVRRVCVLLTTLDGGVSTNLCGGVL